MPSGSGPSFNPLLMELNTHPAYKARQIALVSLIVIQIRKPWNFKPDRSGAGRAKRPKTRSLPRWIWVAMPAMTLKALRPNQ